MITKAMILAAGLGRRMQTLTNTVPKPLLEVNGKSLLEHHIETLANRGIREIVINVSYLGHLIQQKLGTGTRWQVKIHYSVEPEPLETAGGLRKALPLLGSQPFWVINGDVWTDYPFTHTLLNDHDLAHLVLVPNPKHHPEGDFGLTNLTNGIGRVQHTGPLSTFSGLSILRPELFSLTNSAIKSPVERLAPLLRTAIDAHRVSGEYHLGHWLDVGTPERFEHLQQTARNG